MRLIPLALVITTTLLAAPVAAQDVDGSGSYLEALGRVCPQKRLELLSPANLRDGLDDFISGLPTDQQDALKQEERARCTGLDQGVACVNIADQTAAARLGLLDAMAGSVCGYFVQCREQSVCFRAG
jgi:hypothetical protein